MSERGWSVGLVATMEVGDAAIGCRLRIRFNELDLFVNVERNEHGEFEADVKRLDTPALPH